MPYTCAGGGAGRRAVRGAGGGPGEGAGECAVGGGGEGAVGSGGEGASEGAAGGGKYAADAIGDRSRSGRSPSMDAGSTKGCDENSVCNSTFTVAPPAAFRTVAVEEGLVVLAPLDRHSCVVTMTMSTITAAIDSGNEYSTNQFRTVGNGAPNSSTRI